MRKSTLLLPVLVVAAIAVLSAIFIVDEREKALVLRFGRVVDIKETPGLAFKVPVIDNVVRYDDRILSLEVGPLEVTPLDDRRLIVDAFSRYRIANVDTFRQAVGAGGIGAAESRLDKIMCSRISHRAWWISMTTISPKPSPCAATAARGRRLPFTACATAA